MTKRLRTLALSHAVLLHHCSCSPANLTRVTAPSSMACCCNAAQSKCPFDPGVSGNRTVCTTKEEVTQTEQGSTHLSLCLAITTRTHTFSKPACSETRGHTTERNRHGSPRACNAAHSCIVGLVGLVAASHLDNLRLLSRVWIRLHGIAKLNVGAGQHGNTPGQS